MAKRIHYLLIIAVQLSCQFTLGCSTLRKVDDIEDRLYHQSVNFTAQMVEESYTLRAQIAMQRELLATLEAQVAQIEKRLFGIRFSVTPPIVQMLPDYEALNMTPQ